MQYIFFLITMSAEVELCYKQSSVQSDAIAPTLSLIVVHSKTEELNYLELFSLVQCCFLKIYFYIIFRDQ